MESTVIKNNNCTWNNIQLLLTCKTLHSFLRTGKNYFLSKYGTINALSYPREQHAKMKAGRS